MCTNRNFPVSLQETGKLPLPHAVCYMDSEPFWPLFLLPLIWAFGECPPFRWTGGCHEGPKDP